MVESLILTEIVYVITILFEYISVICATKRANRMASEQDRVPMAPALYGQIRLGYTLSAIIGGIALYLTFLVLSFFNLGVWYYIAFGVILAILLVVRNVLYSVTTNWYLDRRARKIKNQYTAASLGDGEAFKKLIEAEKRNSNNTFNK